nr:hypothetical protein [Tanacetum cinerariifolium]
MTHLVAILTLDSAMSYVMQEASFPQGKASSIPIVFSWGGSISPDGFLPSILLVVVIIITVVIIVITVILVVVVGEASSKVLGLEASGGGVVDLTGDEDPTDEDEDNDIVSNTYGGAKESIEEDDRKRTRFLGGKISSGRKKSRGSNSSYGGNTKDGGKMIGEAIGACGGGIGLNDPQMEPLKGQTQFQSQKRCFSVRPGEIIKEPKSSWKGNLPNLPIILKYSALGYLMY